MSTWFGPIERSHTSFQMNMVFNYLSIFWAMHLFLAIIHLLLIDVSQTNIILDAMVTIENRTCVRFIPRTTEKDYVKIHKSGKGLAET